MIESIKTFLTVLNTSSLILVIIWGILGAIHEIIGPASFENVLYLMNKSLSFEMFCRIGYVLASVLIVTYFLKNKI